MIVLLKTALIFFVKKELDCMKFNRISAIAVTAFAVTLSFALLACSESNPTNADNPIAYSEPALETSSSVTEVSSEVSSSSGEPSGRGCLAMEYTVNDECLPACNDENEGKVETVWVGNPKYGAETFHKCQNGSWVQGDISLTCDTAGVQVGDLCYRTGSTNIFRQSMPGFRRPEYVFEYAGDGVWKRCDGLTKITKECTAENIGDKEKIVYGHDDNTLSMYYKCFDDGWTRIDESTFYCADSVSVSGDSVSGTCSIEVDGKKVYYIYVNGIIEVNAWPANGGWVKASYDSELGFCPETYRPYYVPCGEGSEFLCEVNEYNQPKLRESGWVNYYCKKGQWKQSNLVPNQYMDPRKEGLTDMEYDILDLPKEAKAGDRAGGLLEDCWYDEELYTVDGANVYDYCLSRNFYRYRENGSWTLETREELNSILSSSRECTTEREGEKSFIPQHDGEPGAIYQCLSGYDKPVEYVFNRYEKAGE